MISWNRSSYNFWFKLEENNKNNNKSQKRPWKTYGYKCLRFSIPEKVRLRIVQYATDCVFNTISAFIKDAVFEKFKRLENPELYNPMCIMSEEAISKLLENQKIQMELIKANTEHVKIITDIIANFEALGKVVKNGTTRSEKKGDLPTKKLKTNLIIVYFNRMRKIIFNTLI